MTSLPLKAQADNLSRVADAARAASVIALERQQYEERLSKLEVAKNSYLNLSDIASMLLREGCVSATSIWHDSQDEAKTMLERFAKRYERDHSILMKGDSFTKLIIQLENSSKTTTRRLQLAWQNYVSSQTRVLRPEELAWLRLRSPTQVDAISEAHALLQSASRTLPTNSLQVEAVRRQSARLEHAWKSAWSELTGDASGELPLGARAFLQAVSRQEGAPLDLLTPEVLKWLKAAGGLSDSFKISLK